MRQRAQLAPLAGRLNALSPLSILSRGYALAWHGPERTLVRAASELKPGDGLYLKFGEGAAHAAVTKIEEDPHGQA